MSSKVRMRKVQTAQTMRRSYNKAIDGDEQPDAMNDQFKSMYSQAYGSSFDNRHGSR